MRSRARVVTLLFVVFALAGASSLPAATGDPVLLNEVLASHTGTDTTEYIELFGTPGTSLAGLSLVVVESDVAVGQGGIDRRIDFGAGDSLGANGFYLVGNPTGLGATYSVTPDKTITNDFLENSSLTVALVTTASLSGTSVTGSEVVRDALGLSDGGVGDIFYFSAPVVGPDGSFFPAGARRVTDGVDTDTAADWVIADFNLGTANTPTAGGAAPPPAAPTIAEVQGAGHLSPFANELVSGVEGVVTVKRSSSFWIQDTTPDSNPATSEGLLVFGSTAAAQVAVGDLVRVNGRVTEFRGSPPRPNDLTLTELTSPTVTVVAEDQTVPAPVVIGTGGVMPPVEIIDNDTNGSVEDPAETTFDPAQDGIDFWESYEGMLLQVNNGAVVNETESFGEITLLPDNGLWATGTRTARGGILARDDYGDFNPERFIVDDEILRDLAPTPRPSRAMPLMNVGDRIVGAIVGPLDYSFSNFKIQALATPTFLSGNLQPETTAAPRDQEISVATFNVENLSITPASNVSPAANQAKFERLAGMIVDNLRAPDLIGIEEVQDDSGPANDGVVDATQTWSKLVAEIQAAGGPLYEFRSINPVNNEDGGAPGGNIRVGFLFRTDRGLSFVDRPGGDATTATQVVATPAGPHLSSSPGRVDPEHDAWFETRKPVVGEFRARGKKLFVVVNHFSSKGDDHPLMGHNQPPQRLSEVPNAAGLGGRHAQAEVVNDFVNEILDVDPNANVIVLGDINDFEFSETVDILEGDGELFSAIKTLPANERYSYVFEGNSQVLDQILLSTNIDAQFPYTYDVVHVNSEFANQASDHEPAVVRIDMTGRPAPKP